MLNEILQKNLIKDLEFRDCELVHDQSNVDVRIHKSFVGFNVSFDRIEKSKIQSKRIDENSGLEVLLNSDLFSLMDRNKKSLPLLVGVEAYFLSAAKLILPSTPGGDIDAEEGHMIQFEIARDLTMQELMSFMPLLQESESSDKKFLDLMRGLVGKNF